MNRLVHHVRARLTRLSLLPPVPFIVYALVMAARRELRWDHVALALLVTVLACWNERTRAFCLGAYPIALTSLFYGAMRYGKGFGVSPEGVHLCDLRALELRFFGLTVGGERITLQDYFRARPSGALDLLLAIPYATFIFACFLCAIVLYFRDPAALSRFALGFLLLNLAGFITYHVYPAAPPWYFHAHGCEVNLLTPASPGERLLRVDERLGFPFFQGMYGRASEVFGAVPSLHVAYPLMILIEGWKSFRWPGRALSLVFLPAMCFAAVYLDHHWVIDVLLGLFYCVVTCGLIRLAGPVLLFLTPSSPAPATAEGERPAPSSYPDR